MISNPLTLYRRLRARIAELETANATLEQKIKSLGEWGEPSFNADYTKLWFRNVDFLKDPRFIAAYQAGMKSRHQLGTTPDVEDIHIEWRILVCCWAAWHASRLQGDFVECGVNTGIMSLSVCKYTDWNSLNKSFYLFDTFEGIPPEQIGSDEDHALTQNVYYRDCYSVVQENFAPYERVHIVKGRVPETLTTHQINKVAYLMIDMNILYPEKEALAYFWDKMVPGGIILFDDYGWSGYHLQKDSHDAFARQQGVEILNMPTGQGLLIKP